jgi:hypothetical protein
MLGDVTLVSAESDGPDDTCTVGADQFVSCDMATMAVGETRTITIVVQPNQPLPITNTATVLPTALLDLNVTNNVAVLITEVEAAPTPSPSPSPSPTETQSESPSPVPSGTTPVGGIQTGAGGTAGGSTLPLVLIALAVTASGLFVLRRRARLRG